MADAHGSGPCVRKDMEVQLLSRAPAHLWLRGVGQGFSLPPQNVCRAIVPVMHAAAQVRPIATDQVSLF